MSERIPDSALPEDATAGFCDLLHDRGERWQITIDLREGKPLRVQARRRPLAGGDEPVECGSVREMAEKLSALEGA
jgi:hypothetical protein